MNTPFSTKTLGQKKGLKIRVDFVRSGFVKLLFLSLVLRI